MAAYGSFAYFYDKLQQGVDYEGMARQIDAYVEKFGGRRGILLDAARTRCSMLRSIRNLRAAAAYSTCGRI